MLPRISLRSLLLPILVGLVLLEMSSFGQDSDPEPEPEPTPKPKVTRTPRLRAAPSPKPKGRSVKGPATPKPPKMGRSVEGPENATTAGTTASPVPAAPATAPAARLPSSYGTQACGDFDDPGRTDPFPLNIKWAQFVTDMDKMVLVVKNATKALTTVLTDPAYTGNKTAFPGIFNTTFQSLADIFKPHDDMLDINQAYVQVNEAVDLKTIPKAIELVKSNPTKNMDKGRLKWLEVNAMAATVHHVFNRLTPVLSTADALENIGATMELEYPSWTTAAIQNDTDGYQDMTSPALSDAIHAGMDSMGDKNHLIQVLEKLLCNAYGNKGFDPSSTNWNSQCFGKGSTNPFDHIMDNFDLLIDAAKYLALADMKFAVAQMTFRLYKAYKSDVGTAGANDTIKPADLPNELETLMKNMTERVDKKLKFSPLAPLPANFAVVYGNGGTTFRCSSSPRCPSANGSTILVRETAANCPQGVYLENYKLYKDGTEVALPAGEFDPVKLADGTEVKCIRLTSALVDGAGAVHFCANDGTKCDSDKNITGTPKLTPVIVDTDGKPYSRDADGVGTDGLIQTLPGDKRPWAGQCPGEAIVPPGPEPCPPNATNCPCPQNTTDCPFPCVKNPDGSGDTVKVCNPETGLPPLVEACANKTVKGFEYVDCAHSPLDNTMEFKGAFQGYLETELNLNKGKCIGTCREHKRSTPTCANNTNCELNRRSHCTAETPDCMASSRCPLSARRCEPTSREVTLCPAINGTGKIYEWLNISGKVVQLKGLEDNSTAIFDPANPACPNNGKIGKAQERWAMEAGIILNTPQYCELCMCICETPMTPENYWSFDIEALSTDVAGGFVITALRFEKRNRTAALNIEQGKLLPSGKVDETSLKWLDPEAHTPNRIPLGSGGFSKINMDRIVGRTTDDVATGIRWKVENGALNLEVAFSKWDGKALAETDFRAALDPAPAVPRVKWVGDKDVVSPVKQNGPGQVYPIPPNQHYLEWDATSLKYDMGAAVVPFIDLGEVRAPETYGGNRTFVEVKLQLLSRPGFGGIIQVGGSFYKGF